MEFKRATVSVNGDTYMLRELSAGATELVNESESEITQSFTLLAMSMCDGAGVPLYGFDEVAKGLAEVRALPVSLVRDHLVPAAVALNTESLDDARGKLKRPARQFAYRLALALGEVDVDAMLARIPRRAFLEWLAYHEIEPWSEDRADARAAIVASLIYNTNRRRGAPAKRPREFMAYSGPREPMGPAKLAAFKSMMRRAAGADAD